MEEVESRSQSSGEESIEDVNQPLLDRIAHLERQVSLMVEKEKKHKKKVNKQRVYAAAPPPPPPPPPTSDSEDEEERNKTKPSFWWRMFGVFVGRSRGAGFAPPEEQDDAWVYMSCLSLGFLGAGTLMEAASVAVSEQFGNDARVARWTHFLVTAMQKIIFVYLVVGVLITVIADNAQSYYVAAHGAATLLCLTMSVACGMASGIFVGVIYAAALVADPLRDSNNLFVVLTVWCPILCSLVVSTHKPRKGLAWRVSADIIQLAWVLILAFAIGISVSKWEVVRDARRGIDHIKVKPLVEAVAETCRQARETVAHWLGLRNNGATSS